MSVTRDILIFVKSPISDDLASVCKLRVNAGHKQVKELIGYSRVESTSKLHFDLVVDQAVVQGFVQVRLNAPGRLERVEDARTVSLR